MQTAISTWFSCLLACRLSSPPLAKGRRKQAPFPLSPSGSVWRHAPRQGRGSFQPGISHSPASLQHRAAHVAGRHLAPHRGRDSSCQGPRLEGDAFLQKGSSFSVQLRWAEAQDPRKRGQHPQTLAAAVRHPVLPSVPRGGLDNGLRLVPGPGSLDQGHGLT